MGLCIAYKAETLDRLIAYNNRPNKIRQCEYIDLVPVKFIAKYITEIATKLRMDGLSNLYKRWEIKDVMGRETLKKYIDTFKAEINMHSKHFKLNEKAKNIQKQKQVDEAFDKQTDRLMYECGRKGIVYDGSKRKKGKITSKNFRFKEINTEDEINLNNKLKILTDAYNMDVVWDEITKLEILQDPKEYVYDLTVPGLESFMIDTGVLVHNTFNSFHHSGVAVMVTTTQGVPRMQELLSLTKNIKTPQMIIYPTKEYMGSRDMANKIASYIEYTTLGDLRGKLAVYYDPDPYKKGGFIEKDRANKVFTPSTSKNSCQADVVAMPWLIRIEFDREKLLEKEVTLVEIKSKFCHIWEKRHTDKTIKKEEK